MAVVSATMVNKMYHEIFVMLVTVSVIVLVLAILNRKDNTRTAAASSFLRKWYRLVVLVVAVLGPKT